MENYETSILVLAFLLGSVVSITDNTHIEIATSSKRTSAAASDTPTIVIVFTSMVLAPGPSIASMVLAPGPSIASMVLAPDPSILSAMLA